VDSQRQRPALTAAKTVFVGAVVVGGLLTLTHGVAGVTWRDVVQVLRGVPAWELGALGALWLGGLCIYSTVLAAALPGLGVGRGLVLNLTGSAVANVVPLGGAVGTALNWRMVTRWGHTNVAFAAFTVLTNLLDVLCKLLLPLVAVGGLVAFSTHVPSGLWWVAGTCAALLLALAVLQRLARGLDGAPLRGPGWWRTALPHVRTAVDRIGHLLATRWQRLLPGSIGYVAAQVALLSACLWAVGLHVPLTVVLVAAAIERLGTLVAITPGGIGVAEIGTVAWLLATGVDPVMAVAGVVLYRAFVVVMEVPVGGIVLAAWLVHERRTPAAPEVPAAEEPEEVAA